MPSLPTTAHVLLVDDDAVIREVLTAWLADQGYECAGAAGVAAALECAAAHPFEVAVLKTSLPDGDGLALARQLRAAHRDLAVVMVTACSGEATVPQDTAADARDCLPRPFTREQVVEAVERAMWRREAGKRLWLDRAHLERLIGERTRDLARRVAWADTTSVEALDNLLVELHRGNPDAVQHARRVARLAVALAAVLGLDETEVAVVERGALLHDIGKLAMPPALMCKPTALTEPEINLIRSHPRAGHAIVSAAASLRLPADIIVSSHEAWDGSGYPLGLARTAIPIGGRITAVADSYDALTWSRAFGGPVSEVRAAAELVRSAGTLFDPDVVGAWLRLLDSGCSLGGEPLDVSAGAELAFQGE
jgi:putative nucleotidyltransferase with HDIG domain